MFHTVNHAEQGLRRCIKWSSDGSSIRERTSSTRVEETMERDGVTSLVSRLLAEPVDVAASKRNGVSNMAALTAAGILMVVESVHARAGLDTLLLRRSENGADDWLYGVAGDSRVD